MRQPIHYVLVGSFIALGIATVMLLEQHWRTKHWLRTKGVIVDFEENSDSESTTKTPIVRFTTSDGTEIEYREAIGSNISLLRRGQRVTVLYNPQNPRSAVMPGWRQYGFPILLGGVAAAIIAKHYFG